MNNWTYSFSNSSTEGSAEYKGSLGGKGANLAQMCLMGVPVPPGFTITTDVCHYYYKNNHTLPSELLEQVASNISLLESQLVGKFGRHDNPLLVSVRSGAPVSMPGMMDTILNLGLNDKTVIGLAKVSNNEKFAYDSYRRFIQMYAEVVLKLDHYLFEEILDIRKKDININSDSDFSVEELKEIVEQFKEIVLAETEDGFPQDVNIQLSTAVKAVFESWMNERAKIYRKLNNINADIGTAVTVQSMVFGNMGEESATGVVFTRNPSDGDNKLYGEYMLDAQGEDVVAGIRTPMNIDSLKEVLPRCFNELQRVTSDLELHFGDMQDVEFTIQRGKLWILQTRPGKRTAASAVKIAVDMAEAGLISKDEALLRVDPNCLDQLLHPTLNPKAQRNIITKGLPASPGAVSGKVVFSANVAEKMSSQYKVILVRSETTPEDIHGMYAAEGILTSRGGMTSHAAVVARGMGKCCIAGAVNITINVNNKNFVVGGIEVNEGDVITLNGSTGEVMLGEVPTIKPSLSAEFKKMMRWASERRGLDVRANAETPHDVRVAKNFGAKGIGLCRTEHMFFDSDRINSVREMILSNTLDARKRALDKILPMQTKDFIEIFNIMDGLPVNIRLLDPPLHEFLPATRNDIQDVASFTGMTEEYIHSRIGQLSEQNPMLGHRGCRLGITYPEIYEMQSLAIFRAMLEMKKLAKTTSVEIMVPLIFSGRELEIVRKRIDSVAEKICKKENVELNYQVGTMIEVPAAALKSAEIAEIADFFSFGTNDLTQTTLGISRDDSSSFITKYKECGVLKDDPFVTIQDTGVDELVKISVNRGRAIKPNLKIGICGEHGGDPRTIQICNELGLSYVSCSPYRVPIAILAAAQANILKASLKVEKQKLEKIS
jgi:pyruvate, orthophosphate dikinase